MPGIDAFLLDITERFCQRFQKLTGKTNVWIAVQLTNLSIIVYFFSAAFFFPLLPNLSWRLAVVLSCAMVLYALSQTVFKESIRSAEGNAYTRVAKGLRNPRRRRDAPLRISFLMTSVLMVYLLAFVYIVRRVSPQFAAYQAPLYVVWLSSSLIALTTVLLYVIACDPLPPCVGKVRIWLRGFAPQRLPARESPAVDSRRRFPGVMMFCHRSA
jgi:MFS family permease